jgi:hypothetical protein
MASGRRTLTSRRQLPRKIKKDGGAELTLFSRPFHKKTQQNDHVSPDPSGTKGVAAKRGS